MSIARVFFTVAFTAFFVDIALGAGDTAPKGRLLSGMTWLDAKTALTPEAVVVIPVGAESKEHGLHMPLGTDFLQAEYYKGRVLAAANVVIAPTVNYFYYPAFVEYPGTTNLSLPVARELLLDVVHGIAKFGPRRFYVINIGVATNKPLAEAAALLAIEGISLRYLDLTGSAVYALEKQVLTQKEGSHADEIETSTMLAIDPSAVDMKKAAVEYIEGAPARGLFSPDPKSARYSASGVYGDATRATVDKGRILLEGMTRIILDEIEDLRRTTPPTPAVLFGRLEQPSKPNESQPKTRASRK
jgi:creatinine amidohydrolase